MNFSAGSLNSKTPNYRPKYDDRKGLGYGVLEPQFQKNRQSQSSFPYKDPDTHTGAEGDNLDEEELDAFVSKVNGQYYGSDMLAKKDPFFRFAGNSPARSLAAEVMNVNPKSMSPLPRSYSGAKGADGATGGTAPLAFGGPTLGFRSAIRPTGTKRGFSAAPAPVSGIQAIIDEPMFDIRDTEDKETKPIRDLRKLVRHVLKGQLYENP